MPRKKMVNIINSHFYHNYYCQHQIRSSFFHFILDYGCEFQREWENEKVGVSVERVP